MQRRASIWAPRIRAPRIRAPRDESPPRLPNESPPRPPNKRSTCMSRREAVLSAAVVFLVALAVRAWAATQITYPRPEDVAYYVGVSRNLLEGHGLTSDAIWSFQTPPLSFPRPAFEVWLPLPSILAAIPMAFLGTTFAAAQWSSIVVGSVVAVLGWRLAADVAAARGMPVGRARTLAIGTGLTAAVYLPLVLASVQPDSTMPFAALVLGACLVMTRLERANGWARTRGRDLVALGVLLGLAALTRNEAIWLALTWAFVAWRIAGREVAAFLARPVRGATSAGRPVVDRSSMSRVGQWIGLLAPPAVVAIIAFAPWAYRDWLAFGSPLPGQALTNALSLDGRDIFAWQDRPTVARYLGAGIGTLLELRWTGFVHNVTDVLLLLGVPVSAIGLVGLVGVARPRRSAAAAASGPSNGVASPGAAEPSSVDPLRPLVIFSILTFLAATLLFPVSTTWGTFLHAAGATHVLLVISALLVLDRLIVWVGARRGWHRPVAWLGPAFAIAGCLLFSAVLLPGDGKASRDTAARYDALAAAVGGPDGLLAAEPGPVITDFPIWFSEATRHRALGLPNESVDSILNLARTFDPPARLLIVSADNEGRWPAAILSGGPGSECFVPLELPDPATNPGALDGFLAFRIRCP